MDIFQMTCIFNDYRVSCLVHMITKEMMLYLTSYTNEMNI